MTKEQIADVLKKARSESNLTQQQIADLIKRPQQTIAGWEAGRSQPDANTLFLLFDIYGKSVDEAFGLERKNEATLSLHESETINKYRSIDDHGKGTVDLILDRELARCTAPKLELVRKEYSLKNVIPLPYSDQPASAGRGTYLGPEAFTTIMVEKNDMTKDALFCIPVSGDSMEPTYHDGDILVVERADELRKGEIGIFTLDGDGYVKECGDGELISLNEEYEPIPMNDTILLNGRVTGVLDPEWIVE